MNFQDRRSGRMSVQVQLQEFEEDTRIQHRHRKMQRAAEGRSSYCRDVRAIVFCLELRSEFKAQLQLLCRQRAGGETVTKLFEHAIEHKCERFKQNDGMFKFYRFFENHRWFNEFQDVIGSTAGQLL